MLVFGSFTEDEIKFLRGQPPENDIEIKFGSLDIATLRSVGIFNTKAAGIENSKGQLSKLVNKPTLGSGTVCTIEDTSQIVAATGDENGRIHDSYPVRHSDIAKELKTNNTDLPGSCLSDQSNQSTPKRHGIGVTLSSNHCESDALVASPDIVDIADAKENIHKVSDELCANDRNLVPRGLVNLGNLCFLNATLQALLSCPPFVVLLQELRTRDIPKVGYPALHAFVDFISDFDMQTEWSTKKKSMVVLETGRPFRPIMFESILKSFSPDVPNSMSGRPRQEDAQEFLSFVMHQMHDELLKLEGQIPIENGGKASLVSSMNDEDDNDDNWETVGPKNKTAITRTHSFIPSKLSEIFGGKLKSVVKARGSKASATIQPFLLLHLNISPDPICSIEDALRLFSAPETLEGYRTSAAGKAEVVNASKFVKILELSEIMILHLMRFSYGSEGSTKLHKPVHFPLDLVLGRELLVSPSPEGRRYELVATITHHGRDPSKGHYTADSRHPSGKWLRYDDASVTVISTSKVLHDQAYILFYKQL
ncbi:ubiquitin carboxyl-terminal hydrolase 24-like isoform X2 [Cornus florida]|nr:ubiquitin carboxyl-terminal hydrolase 24-like isoform X2 [Cornus florida]